MRTEYESGANNWVAAKETAVGHKNGFYDYSWNWNAMNFTVGQHAVEKVAILCSVSVTGPQVDRLRRAHKSLPHPLKIRTIFEDDQVCIVLHCTALHSLVWWHWVAWGVWRCVTWGDVTLRGVMLRYVVCCDVADDDVVVGSHHVD